MGNRCIIVTKQIRDIASTLNENPNIVANYIGIWQTRNNSSSMPSVDQIKSLIQEFKQTQEGFSPVVPILSKEAVAESAMRLNSLFTPQQLSARIKNVALLFSDSIDNLYGKKIEELKEQLNREVDNYKKLKILNRIALLEDNKVGRNNFVKKFLNIDDAITAVKENLQKRLSDANAVEVTDENQERLEYIKDQYQKMIDSIDYLMVQALSDIEANEGIRIVLSQRENATNNIQLTGTLINENEDVEDSLDEEKAETGNSGWAFKQREADPHDSLTQNVRKILRNIPVVGENTKDDLGFQKYIDAEYAYATILNASVNMIDADDFYHVERDSEGNKLLDEDGEEIATYPLIDKLAERYPWIEAVQNYLYSDPSLASEFYSAFRMDYIPYYMYTSGKFVPVNKEMSTSNSIDTIVKNYEAGNTLSKDSVYSSTGNISKENVSKNLSILDELTNHYSSDSFDSEDYAKLKGVLESLGISIESDLSTFLNMDVEDEETAKSNYQKVYRLIYNARRILNNIEELEQNEHLINHFNTEYTNIAKIVGEVTTSNRSMTFRQGDKDYPSYSTPNYATTVFKKLLSLDSNKRKVAFNFYKQTHWFYNEHGWRNYMLEELENDSALIDTLRDGGTIVYMNTIRKEVEGDNPLETVSESVSYSEWTPTEIRSAFINAYFSLQNSNRSSQQYAYYNFPIFADTTCAMFFKFTKFTDNYKEHLIPLLRQVVFQEFSRQKLVQQRKGNAAEIANFDKNGNKFFFFNELNTYLSPVEESVIREYYQNIIDTTTDENVKSIATARLNALPAVKEGTTKALYGDVIKAYRIKQNVNAINAITDTALNDIINKQFLAFLENATNDGSIEVIRNNLMNSKIIPTNEGNNADGALYDTVQEALEEYFWNNTFMQTQIIELMTVDPAYYKFDGGVDFQKRFKGVYASGRKLNTNSKYGRTNERVIYLKDRITVSRNFNKIRDLFDQAVKEHKLTSAQRNEILAKFEEINNADAQAFRSLDSMRAVLDMSNGWTSQMEEAYNSITSGNWNPNNFSVLWQTIKPFLYTVIAKDDGVGGRMLIPHQNKNSEFLLLAAYDIVNNATAGFSKMRALNKFMQDHQIDVVMYESAVKAGNQNPIDINIDLHKIQNIEASKWQQIEDAAKKLLGNKYKEGRNKTNFQAGTKELLNSKKWSQEDYDSIMDFVEPSEERVLEILQNSCFKEDGSENLETIHIFPYSDYMISTPTPEHWIDNRVVDGSQKRNLIISDLPNDPGFRVNVAGHSMTKQEVMNLYNSLYIENLLDDYERVAKEVGDVKSLQESLLQQIKGNPKYSRDFMNMLALKKVGNTADFTIPLDFPSVRNKIAELILSKYKNGVTKQKAKGGSCILVADTENKLNIVFNEDGSVKGFECLLPAWSRELYEDYLITKKEGDREWEELDFEKLQKEAPELLEMSGIRIPTEGKYSITPLIVKGFFPVQSGSAVMLPADVTTIVGCDFDVKHSY